MLQSFEVFSEGEKGRERLATLRARLAELNLQGWLIPRADAHQNENPPPSEERLAWLTGFTGSAGFCVVLPDEAALFVDGRYTIQAPQQVDTAAFTVVAISETKPEVWLEGRSKGLKIGFDTWLHSPAEIERLEKSVSAADGMLVAQDLDALDDVWTDRPAPPASPVRPHPIEFSGMDSEAKRAALGQELTADGIEAAVLTRPDSIAWLFNIRGGDVARTPIALAFSILGADGTATLFIDPKKMSEPVRAHLGPDVQVEPPSAFEPALIAFADQKVAAERESIPVRVVDRLNEAGAEICWRDDPCSLPKAQKNSAELAGARAAHLRDAAAMARFLCWLDQTAPEGDLTEIDAASKLESLRSEHPELTDISFDTISASGPNAALPHYRVNRDSNRPIRPSEIYLIDSGGQYRDGTTDITRTVAIGKPSQDAIRPFTLVLKGMIEVSRARFPKGTTGRDLDVLARAAMWRAGLDFDHGTGHGVGSYLGVHEGPQSLSRRGSGVALETGMMVSNEPGYYLEGAFGIRIENLLAVAEPAEVEGGERALHGFETLTLAPIDRRLIDRDLLNAEERVWLDEYHARVMREVGPLVDEGIRDWLEAVCAPL